jgi:hypothetical protein
MQPEANASGCIYIMKQDETYGPSIRPSTTGATGELAAM